MSAPTEILPVSGVELRTPVAIPDHTLLRVIGRGSYGEVWEARNVMGTPRAVKIVRRHDFDSARPFEREFEGNLLPCGADDLYGDQHRRCVSQ